MTRTAIQPPDMKDQRPRYTHGWRVDDTIYVAGQLPYDKDGNLVGPNDIHVQARRVLNNIRRIVETGGGAMSDVVKVTVYVTDIRYREAYGEVRAEFFASNPPASTFVQIANLAIPGALIEIDAIAAVGR
jgi:reactive intermediate/imine deaminase